MMSIVILMTLLLSRRASEKRNYFSRKGAKAQRKPLETRQRFAPLREKSSSCRYFRGKPIED